MPSLFGPAARQQVAQYSEIYPHPRSPRTRTLPPSISDPQNVLQQDVEAVGLRRLAEARSSADRNLVVIATNGPSLPVTANLVANLADVGVHNYIVLGSTQKVCTDVKGKIACVWSSLLDTYALRARLRSVGAIGVYALWLVRQIYAGRLATMGFNPFLLDADSILFHNPFEAIARNLPGYQLYVMGDHSMTWSNINCGTYYLRNAKPGGRLLSAWTNFERRVFAVLNTSAPFPIATTSGRPERLLVWENTLLDWTFAGAMVGDPEFVGRGRTSNARILTKDENKMMEWVVGYASSSTPSFLGTPGGAYSSRTRLRTLKFDEETALMTPPWLFTAESDRYVKNGDARFWASMPPPTVLIHYVCAGTGLRATGRRAISMKLLGRWFDRDVAWATDGASSCGEECVVSAATAGRTGATSPRRIIGFASPAELSHLPSWSDAGEAALRGRGDNMRSAREQRHLRQIQTLRAFNLLLATLAVETGRTAAMPLFECAGLLGKRSRFSWQLTAQASPSRTACMYRLDGGCFHTMAFPEELALAPANQTHTLRVPESLLGGASERGAAAGHGRPTCLVLDAVLRHLTTEVARHSDSRVLLIDMAPLKRLSEEELLCSQEDVPAVMVGRLARRTCGPEFVGRPHADHKPYTC
jgi:hypothetical protein